MGNQPSKITAQDKAILDLKNQRDKLHRYQRRIGVLTERETEVARRMAASGDRRRALLALRRKKYQEQLLAKTDAQLAQLEQLTRSVEFALIQKDVVFGLRQGTQVLADIHAEMGGLDHVEKLMGDTADAIAYQQEVSDMLGGRITNQDEEEVEDELAAIEAEVNASSRTKTKSQAQAQADTNAPAILPAAPDRPLPESEPEPAQIPPRKAQAERTAMLAS